MAKLLLDERSTQLHAAGNRVSVFGRLAYPAVAVASGFAIAGFSEQWCVIQILLLFALALWYRHPLLWCALVGTLAGFAVVALAPGNAIRTEALRAVGNIGRPVFEALQEALYQTALLIGQTLAHRFYAVVPVLIVGYMAGQSQRVKRRSTLILAVFLGCFAIIVVSILPVFIVSGYPSYRSFTIPTFILIASCGALGYLAACHDLE
jgi:hypothetical protein